MIAGSDRVAAAAGLQRRLPFRSICMAAFERLVRPLRVVWRLRAQFAAGQEPSYESGASFAARLSIAHPLRKPIASTHTLPSSGGVFRLAEPR